MATETLAPAEGVGAGPTPPTPILQAQAVSKQFPGVLALDQVDFELRAGEVHVLFGENGAGKSTLIQMLAGVHVPTAGSLRFRGEPLDLQGVHHARTLGISAVFQEFSLVPTLTVEENLFLGAELTTSSSGSASRCGRASGSRISPAPSSRWSRSPKRSAPTSRC